MDELASLGLLLLIAFTFKGARSAPGTPRKPVSQGTEHQASKTLQSPGAARTQIVDAFKAEAGREPTTEELALLLAHSAGETGRWRSMYGWNYGFTTTNGGADWFALPGNPLKFKWFADAPTGARDWLSTLRSAFPDAWAALPSGDPAQYVQGLLHGKHGSYFGPAPVPAYERLVRLLYAEYLPLAKGKAQAAPNSAARGQAGWLLPLRQGKA